MSFFFWLIINYKVRVIILMHPSTFYQSNSFNKGEKELYAHLKHIEEEKEKLRNNPISYLGRVNLKDHQKDGKLDLILISENNELFKKIESDFNELVSSYISNFKNSILHSNEEDSAMYKYVLSKWEEINRIRDEREIFLSLNMDDNNKENEENVNYDEVIITDSKDKDNVSLKSCLKLSDKDVNRKKKIMWAENLVTQLN